MYIGIFLRVILTEISVFLHPTYLTFPFLYWEAFKEIACSSTTLSFLSLPAASPSLNYTELVKGGFKDHPNFGDKIITNRCFISSTLENSPAGGKFVYMEAVNPH